MLKVRQKHSRLLIVLPKYVWPGELECYKDERESNLLILILWSHAINIKTLLPNVILHLYCFKNNFIMKYITNSRCYKPIKDFISISFRLTYKTKCKTVNKMNIGCFLLREDPKITAQIRQWLVSVRCRRADIVKGSGLVSGSVLPSDTLSLCRAVLKVLPSAAVSQQLAYKHLAHI